MEAIKLTWYQIFFNNQFGYRKDYQTSFWYYINQYVKRYIVNVWYYTNGVKKPYSKQVEKKGPRGGRTNYYHSVIIPASKPTHINLKLAFIPRTWFAFYIKFGWSNYVYRAYEFSLGIVKLNWNIEIKVNNN